MEKIEIKIGDIVVYNGERWEVGFIKRIHYAGTVRLQKSGVAGARQINYICPENLQKKEVGK